ncbi:calcium-dependent phospholipid-binding Copine family protein [Artemisia annua]|uniref:Calcium-dependent phospholipid-binding Copine family protein n=1 Tax=Artemisia annua TaxID=35608 RepID=A0A2U1PTD6_ARTAN|nr:calcium-dependent phospholipid-binding Copine family protein [Artemisia annua]
MGGCFSDVRGGQAAVGGGGGHNNNRLPTNSNSNSNPDEAVDYFYRSKGLQPLYTRIELSLSGSKLYDRDILSKSDPMAVVYAKKKNGALEELGRTEVIMNNLNPMWIQKISVAFQFEIVQPLVFQVYDVDTKYHNMSTKMLDLKAQDFVGEATCALSEIMTLRSRSKTLQLHGRNGHHTGTLGSINVHAEETIASKMAVEMRLRCTNLDNKDRFSKSDPFLRVSRIVEAGGPIPICKTEVVNNNLNPVWKPLCITMQQYGSKDNPLVIECFDFNSDGNHVLIGKMQTSIEGLEKLYQAKAGANFVYPSSRHHSEKVLKGSLFVDGYVEKELYSFLDYISSGFELNFMVAVDFTASNGDPRRSDSLHYIDPSGRLNSYQQAIMEVGEVIQVYDYDKRFPAWGFGGRMFDGSVSHCFNLNGQAGNFEVEGVHGIMTAYQSALHTVSLHGPTLFGQIINQAAEIAGQSLSTNSNKYFVLLIITDGEITDIQETKDALVRASDLPLSILIVGVGNADFKKMEILDADNGKRLESSTGRVATRDIVQFVPVRDVHNGEISMVQSLLEELPGQFLTYMRSRDIKPLNVNVHNVPYPPDPLMT